MDPRVVSLYRLATARDPWEGSTVGDRDIRRSPDFVEQTILLPRSLWSRIEELCTESGKEPSELVTEAIRLLMARGGHGVPASVAGPAASGISWLAEAAGSSRAGRIAGAVVDVEERLAAVREEQLVGQELRARLAEIMAAVEAKDHFIERHSEKVASLARRVAEALGRAGDEVEAIDTAGLLHDLGKSRVPEEILGKKGRLTADEWALVKRYPEFSADLLAPLTDLAAVVPLVRHHQERWDGSGYPDGLSGDDIPLGAQIVGLCDVYDVLTSDRSYRPSLPPDVARRTLEGGTGRLWNPVVAETLLKKVLA